MSAKLSRRDVLSTALAASFAGLLGGSREALASTLKFGPAKPFSFAALSKRAREAAAKAYLPPKKPAPQIVEQIDYAQHGKIKYRADQIGRAHV